MMTSRVRSCTSTFVPRSSPVLRPGRGASFRAPACRRSRRMVAAAANANQNLRRVLPLGPARRAPVSAPRSLVPHLRCSVAAWGISPKFDLSRLQAAKTPNAPAITYENKTMSYGELDELTDRMAFWLQKQGCGLESIGVIYMNKQTEYMVAYIAILKAGAAYLPMDVAYPPDLVDMVLADAKPKAIITTAEYYERSGSKFGPVFLLGAP